MHNRIAQFMDERRQAPMELRKGHLTVRGRRCINQIAHSLRLQEIHLSIEHGALCKLARIRRSSSKLHQGGNECVYDTYAAVTRKLHEGFACIRTRSIKTRDQRLVDWLVIDRVAQLRIRGEPWLIRPAARDTPTKAVSLGTAEPYNGNRASAGRRAHRNDRIGAQLHQQLSCLAAPFRAARAYAFFGGDPLARSLAISHCCGSAAIFCTA
jgi:hypothetical protein